jgi:hypothetical protein
MRMDPRVACTGSTRFAPRFGLTVLLTVSKVRPWIELLVNQSVTVEFESLPSTIISST